MWLLLGYVTEWITRAHTPLLLFVAGIYALVGLSFATQRNPGLALAWLAYAVANIGFVIASRQ